ncbi:MAG: hypothetical protein JSU66_16425 [Deltaproteobacteria bacterium]|nr:MAG: hypothetical protein JSU66_16425 [Deltaproteobacteria bacterium]
MSDEAFQPNTEAAIGVAAFERVGPQGVELPDVATPLAAQLAAKAAVRVVGPESLGAPPVAEPLAEEVRQWAAAADVEDLVVGRTTRLGRTLSIDARLHSGASGEVIGTFVAEIDRGDRLQGGVDRLAEQILDALGSPRRTEAAAAPEPATVTPMPVAAAPAAAAPPPDAAPKRGAAGFLDAGFSDDGGPIDIAAGETEFLLESGRTIFRDDVRVKQGDVTLTTDRLEAAFDEESRTPEQLIAEGNVRIVQDDRTVTCQRAVYEATARTVFCRGAARAVIGKNTVHGEEIEFRIEEKRVFVRGSGAERAEVRIAGEEKPSAGEAQP